MAATRTVHVLISGRVQGVGFRYWTEGRAKTLGLAGWVRNLSGGEVEAVFTGPADAVDKMLAAVREGPPGAKTERVKVVGETEPLSGAFTIRRDR